MVVKKHDGGFLGILWGTWDDFWQATSISGANNAGNARSAPYIRRIIWIIIFVLFFGLTCKGVYDIFVEYYEYPVTTSVFVEHQNKINFPAVTVCNQNRVHCLNLNTVIEECEAGDMTKCGTTQFLNIMKELAVSCQGPGQTTGPPSPPPADDPPPDDNPPPGPDTDSGVTTVAPSPPGPDTTIVPSPPANPPPSGPDTTQAPASPPGPDTPAPPPGGPDTTLAPSPPGPDTTQAPSPPAPDTNPPGPDSPDTTTTNPPGGPETTTVVNAPPPGPPPSPPPGGPGGPPGKKKRSISVEEDMTDFLESRGHEIRKRQTPPSGGPDGRPPSNDDLGAQPESQKKANQFLSKYMTLDYPQRQYIGHNFSDMIQACTFRGRDCLESDNFMLISSPGFGNCYTFNSRSNELDALGGYRVSSMTGPYFGLSIVLNIEQGQYQTDGETKQAGARISIHDSDNRAIMDEDGYDLMPNTLSSLAVQEVTHVREAAPYKSNCSGDWEKTNYTKYVPDDWHYSLQQCQRFCSHSSIVEDCDCFHPIFMDTGETFGFRPCNLTAGSDEMNCVDDIMSSLDSGTRNCTCNVDCNEISFDVYISQSQWPSKQYESTASSEYGFDDIESTMPGLSENLLQINVYFKSLNVKTVLETATYPSMADSSFITALGGALSLFLGIALSMVFEVLEFILDLIINICFYFAGSKPDKKVSETPMTPTGDQLKPYSPGFNYKRPPVQ